MAEELQRALREVRAKLLTNPVSPRVEDPRDINLHYCRYVAETVAEGVGDEADIEILEDGGRGFAHTWLSYEDRHYDAECIEGAADYRDLPFFDRHPEAAIQLESGTTDPATLRNRGKQPLYPATFSADDSDGWNGFVSAHDAKSAAAGVLFGLALVAIGTGGLWAVQGQLGPGTAWLRVLLHDLEIAGELIVLVAPIVFFVLRPAHRASARE